MASGKEWNKSNLSKGPAVHEKQDVKGPLPQHHRMAVGESIDGQSNPYGEGKSDSKPSVKDRY